VQYYCTTALSNIAVDANNRKKLAQSENRLIQSLVNLMDSSSPKVQCQAALALRNLASDEKYQLEIVRARGLAPLLRLLQSSYLPLILSAVACIRNISIHPMNESPIIDAGFLKPLVDLLGSTDNEEIQCHAISTLRNLAASSDRNKALVLEAGAVQKCKQLVLDVPLSVQSEMTAAIAVLALSDDLKTHLLNLGVFDVLIPLTASESIEVQGNSAAALGNLSSKGKLHLLSNFALLLTYSSWRLFDIYPRLDRAKRRYPWIPQTISCKRGCDLPTYCHLDAPSVIGVRRQEADKPYWKIRGNCPNDQNHCRYSN
jgi:vacuolar protein 8